MPHPDKHIWAGIAVGELSQGNPAGYPLALFTHYLDLLNVPWYHGWGDTPWRNALYAFSCLIFGGLGVAWVVLHPYLIPYVVLANLPDLEHPVRLWRKYDGYWIHGKYFMQHPILRTQWGMLAWTLVAVLILCLVLI